MEPLQRAAEPAAETAKLDFKTGFDPRSHREWCEVIKDVVAMANSGGGMIVFGANDDGTPSGANLSSLEEVDPATVTDKLAKYIGRQFSDFRFEKVHVFGAPMIALAINGSPVPLVFTSPGTYEVPTPTGKQQQKTAFGQGTIYFRHGAKSEPANSDDLRIVIEREVERVRASWLDGIAKVTAAPPGSVIKVLPPEVKVERAAGEATPVRLTHDASAPAIRAPEFDVLFPYRQKEVMKQLASLPGLRITPHDVQCVRKVYKLDDDPTYSFKHKFGSRQYSDAFVALLVEKYKADPDFFHAAREEWKRTTEATGKKAEPAVQ